MNNPDAMDVAQEELDHTVVVDRSSADAEPEEELDHTVVVDRGATSSQPDAVEDDHTFMVKRSSSSSTPDEDDHTVVVGRKRSAKSSLEAPQDGKRRRGIAQPPVPVGFSQPAVEAMGPGTVETYSPRPLPELPAPPTPVEQGPDATRAHAPSMPSVLGNAHRTARTTVIAFVAACVVSVVGLTIIALVAL